MEILARSDGDNDRTFKLKHIGQAEGIDDHWFQFKLVPDDWNKVLLVILTLH